MPCATGAFSPATGEKAALTLSDAVALLDAPAGATVYIAAWHRENSLTSAIKALGLVPMTYEALMPAYFEAYVVTVSADGR